MSQSRRRRGPKRADAHVRLYGYELACPAYRSLSTDARALLVEFRALFSGGENRIFMSARQMIERLGIGQRRAKRARDDLIERGWIKVIELGAFHRKTKLATVFALTHEPLEDRDGAIAPKDFMRWQPQDKNTVAVAATHRSHGSYCAPRSESQKRPHGSRGSYRSAHFSDFTVVGIATQIGYQAERSEQALAAGGSALEQGQ